MYVCYNVVLNLDIRLTKGEYVNSLRNQSYTERVFQRDGKKLQVGRKRKGGPGLAHE